MHFCEDEFWDYNISWNTEYPEATECFKNTVFVPLPFLIIGGILFCYVCKDVESKKSGFLDNPRGCQFYITLACSTLLFVLSLHEIIELFGTFTSLEMFSITTCLAPVITTLTYLMSIFYTCSGIYRYNTVHCVYSVTWIFMFVTACIDMITTSPITAMKWIIFVAITAQMLCTSVGSDHYQVGTSPLHNSFSLSKLFYIPVLPLLYKGYRHPLTDFEVWKLREEESSDTLCYEFMNAWKENKPTNNEKNGNTLRRTLMNLYSMKTVTILVIDAIFEQLALLGPIILGLLVAHCKSDEFTWKGIVYTCILIGSQVLKSFTNSFSTVQMCVVGCKVKSIVMNAVYKKTLKLSARDDVNQSFGSSMNLISVDSHKIFLFFATIHMVSRSALTLILSLFYLFGKLGACYVPAVAFLSLSMSFGVVMINFSRNYDVKYVQIQDDRMSILSNLLNGIKMLKLYAWEEKFQTNIEKLRSEELKFLTKSKRIISVPRITNGVLLAVMVLLTLLTATASGHYELFTPEIIFPCISMMGIQHFSLMRLVLSVPNIVHFMISFKRISTFMELEETKRKSSAYRNEYSDLYDRVNSVEMKNCTFSWNVNSDKATTLSNINLNVKKGDLVAVIGKVGSGKSSLLAAILGEIMKIKGTALKYGRVAYVPQEAWIQNASMRDNIMFWTPMKGQYYKSVLSNCALLEDLKLLPAADLTEIGENGINLSGGQKQRVSLARAIYNNADIYLLDDPLSAVDIDVKNHIFRNVFNSNTGILKNKTRILVTNWVECLKHCDKIAIMQDGQISFYGTYEQMQLQQKSLENDEEKQLFDLNFETAHNGQDSDKLGAPLKHHFNDIKSAIVSLKAQDMPHNENQNNLDKSSFLEESSDDIDEIDEKKTLIQKENIPEGVISWNTYRRYLRFSGPVNVCSYVLSYIVYRVVDICSFFWLIHWSKNVIQGAQGHDYDTAVRDNLIYASFSLASGMLLNVALHFVIRGTMQASGNSHDEMLRSILRAPLQFFDTTPTGRILSRFSIDLTTIDTTLTENIHLLILITTQIIGTLIIICINIPYLLIAIVVLVICSGFSLTMYVSTSRQINRMMLISKSPINNWFVETLQGIACIRAYDVARIFEDEMKRRVDQSIRYTITSRILCCANYAWIQYLGNIILGTTCLSIVMTRGSFSSELVGFIIFYTFTIGAYMAGIANGFAEFDLNTISVERVNEFIQVKPEAKWKSDDLSLDCQWPSTGAISFNAYSMKYRKNLQCVLNDITIDIKGGEKIGIVGRTGAGKSSVLLGMFRIIEASTGSIFIDGVDISKIGLHDLRSKLSIIPQEPILFTGSLRFNLDPFNKHSDEDLWTVLCKADLKEFIYSCGTGLNLNINSDGSNLSMGQRQLLCLARALLRDSKVLLLDEATSSVDMHTDDLIQTTIRKEFKDCTVLTIAHRLRTVMDSDRILVLGEGRVLEFDNSMSLSADPSSHFHEMIRELNFDLEN